MFPGWVRQQTAPTESFQSDCSDLRTSLEDRDGSDTREVADHSKQD